MPKKEDDHDDTVPKLIKIAGMSRRYDIPQSSMRRITKMRGFPPKIKIGGHSLRETKLVDEFMFNWKPSETDSDCEL